MIKKNTTEQIGICGKDAASGKRAPLRSAVAFILGFAAAPSKMGKKRRH
jgi:hypothetical protein